MPAVALWVAPNGGIAHPAQSDRLMAEPRSLALYMCSPLITVRSLLAAFEAHRLKVLDVSAGAYADGEDADTALPSALQRRGVKSLDARLEALLVDELARGQQRLAVCAVVEEDRHWRLFELEAALAF